jgi:DNA-binding NtrC family response regulator
MMSTTASILVIDDEEIMREILETLLSREGYSVRLATSAEEGLELAKSVPFDAAIVDLMLPGMDGIAALEELKRVNDEMPVVMITAFASVETAIAAMKRGAFDYITKPFKNDEVLVVVRNAVERNRLVQENRTLRRTVQEQYQKFANIIGRSPKMRQVFDLIIQAAPSRSTILIQGESGTGKELVARAIHANSLRSDRSFVTVNSGNLPPDLLESTLFGHVKGAFTGAVYPKKGLFDLADKGSIFFDEMGNIPLETQAKLLRAMQEREFMRLGGMEVIKVDVRIIAATNVDLKRMVDDGRFREDLRFAIASRTSRRWCSTSCRSTARRTARTGWSWRPRRSICSSTTTGRATSASSRTSSSVRSCSPRVRGSAPISSPTTSARRRPSRFRKSPCRPRASRSRKSSPISRSA